MKAFLKLCPVLVLAGMLLSGVDDMDPTKLLPYDAHTMPVARFSSFPAKVIRNTI